MNPIASSATACRFTPGVHRTDTPQRRAAGISIMSRPTPYLLRIVSKYGVGLDMIDIPAARRCGVSVRWTPGVNRQAVAELAIGFMLALSRGTVALAREMRDGGWRQPGGRQLSSAS